MGMTYVSNESLARAQSMEDSLLKLSPTSGILFLSVRAEPEEGGTSKKFSVFVGVDKRLPEITARTAFTNVVAVHLPIGAELVMDVRRGISVWPS